MRARTNYVAVANDIGASDKAIALPESTFLAGIGLVVLCIAYCDRQRTDGRIPTSALKRVIAPGIDHDEALADLLRVGWLLEREDGFEVADYLTWQRSKAEIEATIEKKRAAGALGGKKKAENAKAKEQDQDHNPHTTREDKSELGEVPSMVHSEMPSTMLDESEVDSIVQTTGMAAAAARSRIKEHGAGIVRAAVKHIKAHPPKEAIKSWPKLIDWTIENVNLVPLPSGDQPCTLCHGTGEIEIAGEDRPSYCPRCNGAGHE